jgi:hypothetical protein
MLKRKNDYNVPPPVVPFNTTVALQLGAILVVVVAIVSMFMVFVIGPVLNSYKHDMCVINGIEQILYEGPGSEIGTRERTYIRKDGATVTLTTSSQGSKMEAVPGDDCPTTEEGEQS